MFDSYVIHTLDELVADDYMIVYFHGATPRRQMPSFTWLKRCYQGIDRRWVKLGEEQRDLNGEGGGVRKGGGNGAAVLLTVQMKNPK